MVKNFDGIHSAIFSVYDENLNIKKDTVRKMVDHQKKCGIKGFYVGGNTGECSVLPNRTRKDMLEAVIEERGDMQVIAHIGAVRWEDTVDLVKHADSMPIDAIASLPPSLGLCAYTTEETIDYYTALSEYTDKPIFAYITGVYKGDLVELAEKFAKAPNIIGIKLSVPNYYGFERIRNANSDMILFNGPDESMLSGLIMGANGAIGTSYNILPETAIQVYNNFKNGDLDKAFAAQNKLNDMIALAAGRNMSFWKALLEVKEGFDMGYTVFPAKKVTQEEKELISNLFKRIGEL